jgi:periplasmic divalent cation tolerance protein
MEIIIVYVPVPDHTTGHSLAQLLLEKKLIACANIIGSKSLYFWENLLTNEEEFILICKTITGKMEEINRCLISVHPYDIPAILHWEVKCNPKYHEWVTSQIG